MTLADPGVGDEARANFIESIELLAGDPDALASFRSDLADKDPDAQELTDEQVIAQLNEVADRLFSTPTEAIIDKWAELDFWGARVAEFVSDAVLDGWMKAFLSRATGY